jgi:hypothetical protein
MLSIQAITGNLTYDQPKGKLVSPRQTVFRLGIQEHLGVLPDWLALLEIS